MKKVKNIKRKILLLTATNSQREVEELGEISKKRGIAFSAYLSENGKLILFSPKKKFQKKRSLDFMKLEKYDAVIACCDTSTGYTVPSWIAFICGYCFEKQIPVIGYICNPSLYGEKLPPSVIYESQDQASQADSNEYVNLMIQESCTAFLVGTFGTVLDYLDLQKEPIKAKRFTENEVSNGNGIYLAGPDIFGKDKLYHCSLQKAILLQHGLKPEHPIDNNLIEDTSPWGIFQADVKQINRSKAIFANLQPYAGQEPDDGTMFEVGYGVAKGLAIYAYPGELFTNLKNSGETVTSYIVFMSETIKLAKKMAKKLQKDYVTCWNTYESDSYGNTMKFIWKEILKVDSLNTSCQKFLTFNSNN